MTFRFDRYIKIKDTCCICYFGHNPEYVVQLNLIRPYLEKNFVGLTFFLSCRDELFEIIENDKNVIKKLDLYANKKDFGFIKEILIDDTNVIEKLLFRSGFKRSSICRFLLSPCVYIVYFN